VWGLAVDSAANTLACAKHFFHDTCQVLRQRFRTHRPRNVQHIIEGNVATVLDVLLFFAITGWLWKKQLRVSNHSSAMNRNSNTLKSSDNEGAGGGNNRDGSLAILDGQLDGDPKPFPCSSGFGDIFADFFGSLHLH
jgi:hypothetical protein